MRFPIGQPSSEGGSEALGCFLHVHVRARGLTCVQGEGSLSTERVWVPCDPRKEGSGVRRGVYSGGRRWSELGWWRLSQGAPVSCGRGLSCRSALS